MRSKWSSCAALALVMAAASGCSGAAEEPALDAEPDLREGPTEASAQGADETIESIQVAEGIHRVVTRESMEPTAEVTTKEGSYVAIWVHPSGASAVFEGIPAGATSALQRVSADSPLELFRKIAPPDQVAPERLHHGRRFSELLAEAEQAQQALPEDRPIMRTAEGQSEITGSPSLAATSCDKNQANDFYDNYRPGAISDQEGVLEWSPSNFQYREARRRKDYQAFFQTNFDQWTPTQSVGALQANYFRATASMCTGSGRLTVWLCANSQATADNGCGAPGSSIHATHGPYSMGAGGIGTYAIFPGGDLARARLDQMTDGDHALWSVMSSNSSYGAINGCYN